MPPETSDIEATDSWGLVIVLNSQGGGHCHTDLLLRVLKKYHRFWDLDQTHIHPGGKSTAGLTSDRWSSNAVGELGVGANVDDVAEEVDVIDDPDVVRTGGGGREIFGGGGGTLPFEPCC